LYIIVLINRNVERSKNILSVFCFHNERMIGIEKTYLNVKEKSKKAWCHFTTAIVIKVWCHFTAAIVIKVWCHFTAAIVIKVWCNFTVAIVIKVWCHFTAVTIIKVWCHITAVTILQSTMSFHFSNYPVNYDVISLQ
jgi:hypothetical protein